MRENLQKLIGACSPREVLRKLFFPLILAAVTGWVGWVTQTMVRLDSNVAYIAGALQLKYPGRSTIDREPGNFRPQDDNTRDSEKRAHLDDKPASSRSAVRAYRSEAPAENGTLQARRFCSRTLYTLGRDRT